MTHYRTFRILVVGTLSTVMLGVMLLSAILLLWPVWCEFSDAKAMRKALTVINTTPADLIATVESIQKARGNDAVVSAFCHLMRDSNANVRLESSSILNTLLSYQEFLPDMLIVTCCPTVYAS